jgi:hypothetical protein
VRRQNYAFLALVLLAVVSLAAEGAQASTIIKLNLGGDAGADIEFDGTTLSTADDGDAATTGDQNTDAEFLTFLDGVAADILDDVASFTLDGLTEDGPAVLLPGGLVGQGFNDGALSLYDAANVLLLSATLDGSVLIGTIGGTATGSVFTTEFATVTGGTLAPFIDPTTLTLSISLVDVNDGAGLFVLAGAAPFLDVFHADATLLMDAEEREVAEPATALLLLGATLAGAMRLRRTR